MTVVSGQSVYVLSVPSGYFKVGIAKDPEARRRDLQCGNPEPISLDYGVCPEDGIDTRRIERRVHGLLAERRVCGEWFKASKGELHWALKLAWVEQRHPGIAERYWRMKGGRRADGPALVATGGYSRNARWREKHRDRYNEYQRELMRRRRA